MIKSFGGRHGKDTEEFWRTGKSQGMPPANLRNVAKRKLAQVHAATQLDDLNIPPKNMLEKLIGNRGGQYSIRINDQYRVCFAWENGDAYDVEVTDYH